MKPQPLRAWPRGPLTSSAGSSRDGKGARGDCSAECPPPCCRCPPGLAAGQPGTSCRTLLERIIVLSAAVTQGEEMPPRQPRPPLTPPPACPPTLQAGLLSVTAGLFLGGTCSSLCTLLPLFRASQVTLAAGPWGQPSSAPAVARCSLESVGPPAVPWVDF